jgi:tRNA (guanine26-N2/guanine27-N2)-dimethyltransferase
MAIRMALLSISTAASKYKRCIKPLLCINANFYVRLFVTIYDSAEDCKSNCLKHGYV